MSPFSPFCASGLCICCLYCHVEEWCYWQSDFALHCWCFVHAYICSSEHLQNHGCALFAGRQAGFSVVMVPQVQGTGCCCLFNKLFLNLATCECVIGRKKLLPHFLVLTHSGWGCTSSGVYVLCIDMHASKSYHRKLRSLLYLCYVFWALMPLCVDSFWSNSWFILRFLHQTSCADKLWAVISQNSSVESKGKFNASSPELLYSSVGMSLRLATFEIVFLLVSLLWFAIKSARSVIMNNCACLWSKNKQNTNTSLLLVDAGFIPAASVCCLSFYSCCFCLLPLVF